MSDLKTAFEQAVAESKQLPGKPDNATLLELYALYKQATLGDVQGERPGMTDFVARAKWDAWQGRLGLAPEDAMRRDIERVDALK